jgi:hypothetical protein
MCSSLNELEIKTATENVIINLEPAIRNMLLDAPRFGNIGLTIIFQNGIVKRIEINSNKSILCSE